ncbi:hypothetical protein QO206_10435 [Leeuwenhoekiella aequorea]|uniref:hypothetical protein n=1 Tax=Leeuwenhoekiella TaxID=283735 RepID=UPI00352EAB44|tara:strand:- start:66 stop:452 length:387 start_codon:yes stop_codon:yes gene_type:complete
MRLLLIFSIILIASGCKSDKVLELDKIEGFPTKMIGCSCYYAVSEEDFAAQKFIYLDKYGEAPGMINVAGDLIAVDPENKDLKNYQIQIEVEKEVQLDQELFHKEGILTVTAPDGAVFTTPIYGECGC